MHTHKTLPHTVLIHKHILYYQVIKDKGYTVRVQLCFKTGKVKVVHPVCGDKSLPAQNDLAKNPNDRCHSQTD